MFAYAVPPKEKKTTRNLCGRIARIAAEADIRFFSLTVFDSRDGLRRNRETARGLI